MPKQKINIVGGCGHVGLPLGIVFAENGFSTTLYDTSLSKVNMVNEAVMPFIDEGAEECLKKVIQSGALKASTNVSTVADADVIVLTIGTVLYLASLPLGWLSYRRHERKDAAAATGEGVS